MRNATQEDKSTVIAIIKESFQNNPSVVSVINPKKPNSLSALASVVIAKLVYLIFAFIFSLGKRFHAGTKFESIATLR
ncbi:MAG: hypothetical protein RIC35_24845 [Marinoscillum sp.]